MEKNLSPEERIRRAEDIYYKRRLQFDNRQTARVNVEEKSNSFMKKIIIQFLICLAIYLLWNGVKNHNIELFTNINNKIQYILGYDMDLNKFYKTSKEQLEEHAQNIQEEATIETVAPVLEETKKEEAVDSISTVEEMLEDASSINQMNDDAEYIKANVSIIKPLTGTITSRFGLRESDNPKVAGFHTGIDIAVNEGTIFVAAMEGTVTLVSSVGDYRKSF